MEGRQGMRPAPEQLRAHCQYFSRLGWALFGYMAAMLAVQTVVSAAAALLAPGLLVQPVFLWLLSVLSGYGAGGLVFFLVVRGVPAPPPAPARPMGPGKLLRVYVLCLGSTYLVNLITLTLMEVVGLLRGAPVDNPVDQMAAYPMLLNVLLGCVIAPVMEELIFRKLLLSRLRPYGSRFALWASALCFGLFHGNLNQFFYACAVGLVLGWAALSSGRIWQPILLHAGLNAVSTVLLPLVEPLGAPGEALLSLLVLGAILLGAVFFPLLRRSDPLPAHDGPLSPRWTWRVFLESPGTACFLLLSLLLCAAWLL